MLVGGRMTRKAIILNLLFDVALVCAVVATIHWITQCQAGM